MSNKLELTWIGKEKVISLEPRILIENKELSYGERSENLLIHGDNLLALKALEQKYAGRVKCVYIDPPYNTGSAFEHYDDNLEHSTWLSLMKPRLEIIRNLLSNDGSIWISIDQRECHYLKVLCDEIFGRVNFVSNIIWRSSDNSNNDAKQFSLDHNDILVYSKSPNWESYKIERNAEQSKHYGNPDNDPRGAWFDGNPLNSPNPRPNLTYDIIAPNGNIIKPPFNGWRWSRETLEEKMQTGEIRFNSDFTNIKRRTYLNEQKNIPPSTLWADLDETGHNRQAKYEQKNLFPQFNKTQWFGTPKPEKLIEKILNVATLSGDLVLDSFLGSGTTAAVALKMNRKFIGIELGEHCYTHCKPRLDAVIDGRDSGGITKSNEWKGGGGYKFLELAPSLLNKDKYGNQIIAETYNADMLAAAMAKHEGYTYCPDSANLFKQGQCGDKNFIFTTTEAITPEYLDGIASELNPDEYLLICASSFDPACVKRHPNITVEKIPQILLGRCEFGNANYDLNVIENLAELEEEFEENE